MQECSIWWCSPTRTGELFYFIYNFESLLHLHAVVISFVLCALSLCLFLSVCVFVCVGGGYIYMVTKVTLVCEMAIPLEK